LQGNTKQSDTDNTMKPKILYILQGNYFTSSPKKNNRILQREKEHCSCTLVIRAHFIYRQKAIWGLLLR